MMVIFYLSLIVLFSLLLVKATDLVLINLRSLSTHSRAGTFAITGLIAALGTSLPELFVGITSASRGTAVLSLGNIIGANIANLSIIIGGAAMLGGAVTVRGNFIKSDIFYAFLAGAAPMLLLLDKNLSRLDGLVLLALYLLYQVTIFKQRHRVLMNSKSEEGLIPRLLRKLNHRTTQRELGWLFLGLLLMLLSADFIVLSAESLAYLLNIPVILIGLVLLSLGTCLPELTFEYQAIRQHQPQMIFGNLLGSIAANATFILGLVTLISPIQIQAFSQYLLATITFVVIFAAFYLFVRTKHRLDRWEGALLIGLYLAFVLAEFVHP